MLPRLCEIASQDTLEGAATDSFTSLLKYIVFLKANLDFITSEVHRFTVCSDFADLS